MGLEMIILRKSERDKYHMILLICEILKKKREREIQMNVFTKQRRVSEKTNLWLPKGKGKRGIS